MKNIVFLFTFLFIDFSFSQEIECIKNYEYEILENLDAETLKSISNYYLSKTGICNIKVITRNSEFFISISTTDIVDQNSINLLTSSAFNKFKIKTKGCDHEKI